MFLIPSKNNQSENKTTTKNRRTTKVKTVDEFLNKDGIDASKQINNNDDDLDI